MAAHVTLHFLRKNTLPSGARFHVLWNGQRASNGDGIPADNPAEPVDEASPLTMNPIPIWPYGKAGDGLNEDGNEADGYPHNPAASAFGDGCGVDGDGEDGLYNDFVCWDTRTALPTLRDGTYKFAVRLEDTLGTVQTDPLQEVAITIAGTPRPPRSLTFVQWNAGTGELELAWAHSPDLE